MDSKEIEDMQLFIINGQLIGTFLYIVSLFISLLLIINQKKIAKGEDGFFTQSESQNIALLNKVLILILLFLFIYLDYKSRELAKITGQDTSSLNLQIKASWIALIPALIGLYVVATDYANSNLQTAEIENPFA